ncbi:hypothetical protein SNOG_13387 [Parastagonospora nodorum SN15]|uniref:Uncharacterized protein n=1 Tax=Phaeosphaeria nodorum (strain SN15 / ATCC MYA-4574 / FGSC 10173) TaxID=321614 RepID=Q0U4C7_PHANO|nr:hypothetical protein SNOG_13387 [Parastagonospora nodorum SN15]EAT79271.1 hypothetical protein SNOG_13387 [Parastagonospora nodorum SN15]
MADPLTDVKDCLVQDRGNIDVPSLLHLSKDTCVGKRAKELCDHHVRTGHKDHSHNM